MAGLSAHVPIAGLSPDLEAQSSKSVKAIVTLTWPYSSATGSVAFLLAEPDFRLRRSKGQVRVQFSGASAKRIAKSSIASGDEVIVSLDGVEWLRDASAPSTPGSGVDFELKFTERLLLQFTPEGSDTKELIDIDHPSPEPEQDPIPTREITPEPPVSLDSDKLPKREAALKNGEEWASPAFIKRARSSYGSLFDTGYDPFADEDGTIPGKGRKKSRLSSTWRYVSRSPSPELENDSIPASSPTAATTAAPIMADEGSQTVSLGDTDAAETLAHFSREAGSILGNAEPPVTARRHISLSSDLSLLETSRMPPPVMQARIDAIATDSAQQANSQQTTPTQAPSSPRLRPIPSDALPLVSPLVTSQSSPFKTNGDQPHALNDQSIDLFQLPSDSSIERYVTHTTDHHGEEHVPLSTFHEHDMHPHDLHDTNFEEAFHHPDPFWQSASPAVAPTQPTHDHPVHDQPVQEQPIHNQPGRGPFYVGEILESGVVARSFGSNLAGPGMPPPTAPQYPQYETLDSGLHNQGIDNLWESGPATVPYPELPEHEAEETHDESHPLPPSPEKAPAAKDAKSGVVDLTESDEDEDEQGDSGRSLDDRGERSAEASESEEEVEEEDELVDSQGDEVYMDDRRPVHDEEDEIEEGSDVASEEYSEEYERYGREEDLSDQDGEGEEYDEEMEDHEQIQRPSAPKEPVVIDLLSSDEEDNAKETAPAPRARESPQKLPSPEQVDLSEEEEGEDEEVEEEEEDDEEEEDEEEEEEDEDNEEENDKSKEGLEEVDETMADAPQLDTEKDVPHSQEPQLPTSVPQDASPKDEGAPAPIEENADEEFEDAREQNGNKAAEGENIPDTLAAGVADDVKLPSEKSAPSKHRLTGTHNYNLDGANDVGASPTKTTVRTRSRDLKSKAQSVVVDQVQPPLQDSIQLPTPDPTQVSAVKDSQDESATSSGLPGIVDSSQASTAAQAIGSAQDAEGDAHVAEQGEVKPAKETAHSKEDKKDRTEKTSTRRTSARLSHDNRKSETPMDNHVEDSQQTNPPSPRRSRRIRHASGSAAQIAEIMRPSTPEDARAEEKLDEHSPGVPTSLSKQGGQDPSVQMALSALETSPKPHHDLRSTSIVDLKLSLSRALRTDLSEFTALKVLRFHINQKLDVFGIVTSTPGEPQRAKGGPRHYQVTFNITDSSVAPSGVTEVQVFRPYIEALPVVQEGDGILLRNFQVISIKNRGFALRSEQNEACSWAVFKDGVAEPEVRGPPVEYGDAEKKHVAAMKEWYSTLDATSVAKLQRANADKGAGSGGKGISKAS